jgi:hypothetical protein
MFLRAARFSSVLYESSVYTLNPISNGFLSRRARWKLMKRQTCLCAERVVLYTVGSSSRL